MSLQSQTGGSGIFGLSSVLSFEILLKLKKKFLHLLYKKLFSPYIMCMQFTRAMHGGAHCIGRYDQCIRDIMICVEILSVHFQTV